MSEIVTSRLVLYPTLVHLAACAVCGARPQPVLEIGVSNRGRVMVREVPVSAEACRRVMEAGR